jgi:2'-hydroxyisoflavone reductase
VRLLILGGTLFLGRHLVESALARGHQVTLFNRGRTNPDLFSEVERLRGDRQAGDLGALQGRRWDAVIDTSGYLPRAVRNSAELLRDQTQTYVFISSGSVYADFSRPSIDEDAPLRVPDDPSTEDIAQEYGGLKTLCERIVKEVFPDRALIMRAGLIVGPHDPTERFTWWVRRVAQSGEILAPGSPGRQVQLIHARDLADWVVASLEGGDGKGIFNVTGPERRLSMGELLETCKQVSDSDARFTWVDDAFLMEHGVAPFTEMPLWLPPGYEGMLGMDIRRALAAGLTCRPLAETASETLAWDAARAPEERRPREMVSGIQIEAGMDPRREARVLEEWWARLIPSGAHERDDPRNP